MHILTKNSDELDLSLTLRAGQVFCWDFNSDTKQWTGVIGSTVFKLEQSHDFGGIRFEYSGEIDVDSAYATLRDFFQLDVDIVSLLEKWGQNETFRSWIGPDSKFRGIRICRQDPFECLISFIVSANNNIKRISQNLKSIRTRYGNIINDTFHAFPSAAQLRKASSEDLRNLGLGYRSEYIVKTVEMLQDPQIMSQLYSLRSESRPEIAREFLMQFQGVGRKVADCVSLYSLDFRQLAPVDTHMFQIAQKIFPNPVKKDSRMHDIIQKLMIERFGEAAGWAHCFLFAANLKDLQDKTPFEKRARFRE